MPTLVFSQFDALNHIFTPAPDGTVTDGVDSGTVVALSTLLQSTGIGSWGMDPNLSASGVAGSAICEIRAGDTVPALIQSWDIDYDRSILPVPDTAKVKKLTFNRPRSVNYTFNCNDDAENIISFGTFSDAGITPIYFTDFQGSQVITPFLIDEDFVGITADEVLFDLTGGDTFITKAELIALWSSFNNNIEFLLVRIALGGAGLTSALAGSLEFGLGWTVTVEYEEGFEWHLSQSTSPIDEGETSTLTSDPDGDPATTLDMEEIVSIEIQFPDPDNPGMTISIPITIFDAVDAFNLTYTIPSFGVYTPPYFSVVITASGQFSGPLDLGMLFSIYFLSASGIYTLDLNATHDTLYLEDDLPNTIDVKIPNPTVKTGYIDG